MDFNARSAWLERNSDPDLEKARRYGVWYVYVDPTSDNAEAAIEKIEGAGLYPGAYFAPSWRADLGAEAFADWVSSTLNRLLPRRGTAEAPPAMLDLETSDMNWAVDCIARYRQHQPHRPTAYTNAPLQGGLVPYLTLAVARMPFFVQLYYGPSSRGPDMTPADAAATILQATRSYDPRLVHPFYDGARWATDEWDGCQFTLERLP